MTGLNLVKLQQELSTNGLTQPHQFGNSNQATVAEPLTVVAIDFGIKYPAPLGELWLPRHRCADTI